MAVGKGGSAQNQNQSESGSQSGTQTGNTSGINYNVNNGQTSGSSSVTPTTTAGFNSIDQILRGNLGTTGLNKGQQGATDAWSSYLSNPDNGVMQMIAANNKLTPYTNAQAHTVAAPGAITAPGGGEYASNYQNPYTQQVVDATTADATQQFRNNLNNINANYGGTMGNGRAGVAAGQAAGDATRALATSIGGLRSQGFDMSQQLGQQDAGRQLQANVGNVANTMNANQFNAGAHNLADQTSIGAIQQQSNNGQAQQQTGGAALNQWYNMAGGGNNNLMSYLGLQPTGQSSTQTGNQANTSYGINLSDILGQNQGMSTGTSKGNSTGKNGGISAG